jgi:UDP-N-acetylmuramoyl-tripeptide--D-alanyl-D-alanine ligase
MVGRGRGKFATVDKAIAYEFAAVARRTTGSVIIDADNELMVKSVSESDVTAKIVKVSMSDITDYRVTVNRTAFAVSKQIYKFAEPMPPELAIQLAMLGALMRSLDRPVKYDLTKMPVPPGRNNYLRGKDGIDLIDSSYNAHLISMKSILNMYAQIRHAHKWVVLGDMIEQGSVEAEEHEALAKYLLGQKYERIILVGRRMKKYVYPELAAAGRPVEAFEGPKAALEYIELNTAGGESILFKGSQYLDWIVAKLLADPSDVAKLSHHDAKSLARRKKLGLV